MTQTQDEENSSIANSGILYIVMFSSHSQLRLCLNTVQMLLPFSSPVLMLSLSVNDNVNSDAKDYLKFEQPEHPD